MNFHRSKKEVFDNFFSTDGTSATIHMNRYVTKTGKSANRTENHRISADTADFTPGGCDPGKKVVGCFYRDVTLRVYANNQRLPKEDILRRSGATSGSGTEQARRPRQPEGNMTSSSTTSRTEGTTGGQSILQPVTTAAIPQNVRSSSNATRNLAASTSHVPVAILPRYHSHGVGVKGQPGYRKRGKKSKASKAKARVRKKQKKAAASAAATAAAEALQASAQGRTVVTAAATAARANAPSVTPTTLSSSSSASSSVLGAPGHAPMSANASSSNTTSAPPSSLEGEQTSNKRSSSSSSGNNGYQGHANQRRRTEEPSASSTVGGAPGQATVQVTTMSSAAVGISSDSASSSSTPVLQRSRGVHASSKRPLSSGIGGQQVDSNHRRRIEVPTTTSTAQVGIATPPPPPAPVAIAVGVASTGAGSSSTPAAPAPRVRIRPSAYVIQERKKDTLKYTTKHYHHNACSKISNDYLQQKYDPTHPYKQILAVMPFMDLTSKIDFESVRVITFMSHYLSFHLRI